jgi:hypothetical protein
MRRVIGVKLIVLLIAPSLVALGGAAPGVVPCPMHRSSEDAGRAQTDGPAPIHGTSGHHSGSSHHETAQHGCDCASECGSSGAGFSLPAFGHVPIASRVAPEAESAAGLSSVGSADRLLPFSTGPPQRLPA